MIAKSCFLNGASSKIEITTDELFLHLQKQKTGVVLLDGYSGCGKTFLLKKLKSESFRPVYLFSYENVVDEIIRTEANCEKYLLNIDKENSIIGIEDIDYLCGREATQEYLAMMVQQAAKKHLVVLTGNDVRLRVPLIVALCQMDTFVYSDMEE